MSRRRTPTCRSTRGCRQSRRRCRTSARSHQNSTAGTLDRSRDTAAGVTAAEKTRHVTPDAGSFAFDAAEDGGRVVDDLGEGSVWVGEELADPADGVLAVFDKVGEGVGREGGDGLDEGGHGGEVVGDFAEDGGRQFLWVRDE